MHVYVKAGVPAVLFATLLSACGANVGGDKSGHATNRPKAGQPARSDGLKYRIGDQVCVPERLEIHGGSFDALLATVPRGVYVVTNAEPKNAFRGGQYNLKSPGGKTLRGVPASPGIDGYSRLTGDKPCHLKAGTMVV